MEDEQTLDPIHPVLLCFRQKNSSMCICLYSRPTLSPSVGNAFLFKKWSFQLANIYLIALGSNLRIQCIRNDLLARIEYPLLRKAPSHNAKSPTQVH